VFVAGGMLADDDHQRSAGPAGVVEVRQSIAEPGPEMQQRRRGTSGHAAEPVGRAGRDTLEQAQHTPHLRISVERRHEMHLRRAWIRETDIHASGQQAFHHRFGTSHRHSFLSVTHRRRGRHSRGVDS
jgi:hypothetical protein